MKVRITYRNDPFEITFEWETQTGQSESDFDLECYRLLKKLQKVGKTIY